MADPLVWPICTLTPGDVSADLVPFTRSGGRSLGGLEPATRTDRGFWSVTLNSIIVNSRARQQTWQAIRTMLGGRAGTIAVPIWSYGSAPFVDGVKSALRIPHSDGSTFSDGSQYRQCRISVKCADAVAMGATSIRLQIINADANLVGVRFSYEHALYETGPATKIDGAYWTVPIFPAARAAIPAGADLEFDLPTCLCRLADDRGMDRLDDLIKRSASSSIAFVEATDQWVPA